MNLESLCTSASRWIERVQTDPQLQALLTGTASRESYAVFLIQTYHYVRWTKPWLALASERLKTAHPELASIFAQKAGEEDGHEQWVLEDLRALGYSPDVVNEVAPSPAVMAYVHWNQAVVNSDEPAGFLGTAYVLEALSERLSGQAAEALEGLAGFKGAVRFLKGHGEADAEHAPALLRWMAGIEPGPTQTSIERSAKVVQALYTDFFGPFRGSSTPATSTC